MNDITSGLGVNHAVELTGSSELKQFCLSNIACGGTVCPLGESITNDEFSVKVKQHLVGREVTVLGIRGSQLKDQYMFLKMLSLAKINVPIARIMALSDIQKAHRLVEEREVVGKIVILPWGSDK